MAVVGILLLNPLRKRRHLPHLHPTSALGSAHSLAQSRASKGLGTAAGSKPREGEELAPGYTERIKGKEKGRPRSSAWAPHVPPTQERASWGQ